VASLSALDGPAKLVGLSTKDRPNLLDAIPEVRGHTQIPHRYTDHLPRWLSADEQAVYIQLYRLSWGWGNEICFISNPKLSERSGVPETSMRRAVKKLIGKGLIEKTDRRFGGAEQGIEYRVSNLDRLTSQDRASNKNSPSNAAPNKERILKENSKADASQCPDCMGTGFYYPEGTAKGVKRCEHRKLR
jgi:DNA-binding Lrp family transcriptional regulator